MSLSHICWKVDFAKYILIAITIFWVLKSTNGLLISPCYSSDENEFPKLLFYYHSSTDQAGCVFDEIVCLHACWEFSIVAEPLSTSKHFSSNLTLKIISI